MDQFEFEDMLTKVNQMSQSQRQSRASRASKKLNPNIRAKKISFELTISRLFLSKIEDGVDFSIIWVRGEKTIETKVRASNNGQIVFKERFMMKTNIDHNIATDEYSSKPVSQMPCDLN